ncbi:MAG: hypothetical protein OXI61_20340 [Candidatus Poribacteria bacterium]|nr:hypothetical protein [Candidatus Poribacteria bacterium]
MKTAKFTIILAIFLVGGICNPDIQGAPFTYHWEIDETPEGSENATVVEPVQVTLLDEPIEIASHSASFLSLGHFIDLAKKIEGFNSSDKIEYS